MSKSNLALLEGHHHSDSDLWPFAHYHTLGHDHHNDNIRCIAVWSLVESIEHQFTCMGSPLSVCQHKCLRIVHKPLLKRSIQQNFGPPSFSCALPHVSFRPSMSIAPRKTHVHEKKFRATKTRAPKERMIHLPSILEVLVGAVLLR